MTSAAPRETDIPFDQAPSLAEMAERADRHERLRLVRGGEAPALVVMTEDDYDQAMEGAADMAEARAVLAHMGPRDRDPARRAERHAECMAFLDGIRRRTHGT